MGLTKRTTIQLGDERQQLLNQANVIVADSQYDDLPNSDIIDAALIHPVSRESGCCEGGVIN